LSQGAILGLGLVSAGSNNSRVVRQTHPSVDNAVLSIICNLHILASSLSSLTYPLPSPLQAGLLRQLSEFYAKEASHLFVVRIAQGLNSLGKGLIGLGPFHSDR
jgi:hypothetical protein